jgi:tetratricopeptide (TPR) repeat protein
MKKRRQAPAARIASPDVLAERGAEDLKAERFKEAVESYRQLVKIEPRPEWREALVTAYVGRGRTLVAKGMYKEATMVFDNATKIDGAVHEPLVYLACLVRLGDTAKAARLCSKLLDGDRKGVTAEAVPRIADLAAALWLGGDPPPPESSLAKVFEAAGKALAAWSSGASAEEIDALLGAIPLRSPFKPLRLILKSLTGAEDPERRLKLLDMVPPDSAFGSLAHAARLVVAGDTSRIASAWGDLKTSARTFITETGGLPADHAKLLNEIAEAERHGPEAALDALLKNAQRLPQGDLRTACLNLLPRAPKRITKFERQFGALSTAERHRIHALAAGLDKHWDAFEDHWLQYAYELTKSPDPDAALTRSVIYRHLADTALEVPGISDPEYEEDPIANWLQLSVEAYPDDPASVLKLIARLREGGRSKDAGYWADWAVERFPTDAAVLAEALEAAAERRAFSKAADFAVRLLKVDPINTLARQRLSDMRIAHARKKMRQGRTDLAMKELDAAALHQRRDSPDAALTIARGLVAVKSGQSENGWPLVRDGVASLGGGVPAWLRAVLEGRAMGLTEKELQPASKELTKALSAAPTGGEIVAALAALNRREFRDDKRLSAEGLKTIRRWLAKGAACPLSAAEFQTVAETFEKFEAYDLLGDYARAAASRDPGEPLYEFYRVFARVSGKSIWLKITDTDILEKVIERAGERKDVKLVHKVVNFIEEGTPSVPFYEDEFDDPFGDPFGDVPPRMPLDVLRDIEAAGTRALELLATHSHQETVDIMVREFGNSAMAKQLPKGMLKKLFNTLVDEAAGMPEFPPLPQKRHRGRARR